MNTKSDFRFTVWSIAKIMLNQNYRAKLRYVEHKSKEPFNAIEIVREPPSIRDGGDGNDENRAGSAKPVEKEVYSETVMVDDYRYLNGLVDINKNCL